MKKNGKKKRPYLKRKNRIINESSHLYKILDWILLPMFDSQSEFTWEDWLAHSWDIYNRSIRVYTVLKPFIIDGLVILNPTTSIRMNDLYRSRKNTLAFIRYDKLRPWGVDLEVQIGRAGFTKVFRINKSEYKRILPFLEEKST